MKIVIQGSPVAQGRPRVVRSRGKIVAFNPNRDEKAAAREFLIWTIKNMLNSDDKEIAIKASHLALAERYEVATSFHLQKPKSLSERKRKALLGHLKKPDIDNLIKFALDIGNGILWTDDSKITKITAEKQYSDEPKTIIEIVAFLPKDPL